MDVNTTIDDYGDDNLDRLERKLKEVGGERTVTEADLFPDDFVRTYTNFQNVQELLRAGGVEKQEDVDSEASQTSSRPTHSSTVGRRGSVAKIILSAISSGKGYAVTSTSGVVRIFFNTTQLTVVLQEIL